MRVEIERKERRKKETEKENEDGDREEGMKKRRQRGELKYQMIRNSYLMQKHSI